MKILKKIQKLNFSQKKILVFIFLFIIAFPFLFLIFKNFQKRIKEVNKEQFLNKIYLENLKKEFNQMKEIKNFLKIENFSTFNFNTSSKETFEK